MNQKWHNRLKKVKGLWGNRAVVLMYHRIASPACDPWGLAVSEANFETQLQVMQQTGHVVSLPNLLNQVKTGTIRHKSIVLTFDDGYVDNYLAAKPLLEKYQLPATFFIPTGNLGQAKEFWWDELERIILQTPILPARLSIQLLGKQHNFSLEPETELTPALRQQHQQWHESVPPPTTRTKVYMLLWQEIVQETAARQSQILAELRAWAGLPDAARSNYQCMSEQQLLDLAHHPLFRVGAHTVTHTALGFQPAEVQQQEIIGSKNTLEKITGREIDLFSFPNGSYNQSAQNILKATGFKTGVTTFHSAVNKAANPFEMGRFHVNNWPEAEFQGYLNRWLKGY
ncbi:MAG: polysaccharide deacetylase family protein [Adhaeribacter sp.]